MIFQLRTVLGLTSASLIFFALLLPHTVQAGDGPGRLRIVDLTDEGRDFHVFELRGMIGYPLAIELEEALQALPSHRRVLLNLDSGGGSVQEGLKIIEILKRESASGRRIDTDVSNGSTCGSMCVPIYLQGQTRYSGEIAAFMFHGTTPGWWTNVPDVERTRVLLNIFTDAGVRSEWLETLWSLEVFSTPGEYWLTGAELVEQSSGIVTKLVPRHTRFEPQRAPFDPNIRPR